MRFAAGAPFQRHIKKGRARKANTMAYSFSKYVHRNRKSDVAAELLDIARTAAKFRGKEIHSILANIMRDKCSPEALRQIIGNQDKVFEFIDELTTQQTQWQSLNASLRSFPRQPQFGAEEKLAVDANWKACPYSSARAKHRCIIDYWALERTGHGKIISSALLVDWKTGSIFNQKLHWEQLEYYSLIFLANRESQFYRCDTVTPCLCYLDENSIFRAPRGIRSWELECLSEKWNRRANRNDL
jgi:hypothetical protein